MRSDLALPAIVVLYAVVFGLAATVAWLRARVRARRDAARVAGLEREHAEWLKFRQGRRDLGEDDR